MTLFIGTNKNNLFNKDVNKEIVSHIELIKFAVNHSIKDNLIKEAFNLFANKISQALNNSDDYSLMDLIIDKSNLFSSQFKIYEWPVLERKTLDKLNKRTNFFYDIIKYKTEISYLSIQSNSLIQTNSKKFTYEYYKNIFDFYRKYLEIIGNNEGEGLLLNPKIIYQIFSDYETIYKKLVFMMKSNISEYHEIRDEYDEMPIHIGEGIFLPELESLSSSSILDNNTVNLLCLYINYFRCKLFESEIENKDKLIFAYSDKFIKLEQYDQYIINTYPIIFLNIFLIRTIIKFLEFSDDDKNISQTQEEIINLIKLIISTMESTQIITQFIRNPIEIEKYTYIENTLKNLLILFILCIRENMDSLRLKKVIIHLDIDVYYQNFNSSVVINNIPLPYFSFSSKLVDEIKKKVIIFNSKLKREGEIRKIIEIENKLVSIIN